MYKLREIVYYGIIYNMYQVSRTTYSPLVNIADEHQK